MNKEIELLIQMCLNERESYTSGELASFLNLKFENGIHPYLRKLENLDYIQKVRRGSYSINRSNKKVQIIEFITDLFKQDAKLLFTTHAKNILQKFSTKPILNPSELPYHNLRIIKYIANKTRIIYSITQGNSIMYFIRTWEEPTKKLLEFFDIKLQFDEEEYHHKIIKSFSAATVKKEHLVDQQSKELAELNMKYYLEGRDLFLDKLKEIDFPTLSIMDIITKEKNKEFSNPFEITKRIADWKLKYVYNTDKIEGNILTMQDVRDVLTIGSEYVKKDRKAILETTNSRTALDNVFDTSNELTADFIKKLNLATQQGIGESAGNYKTEDNCIVDDSGTLIDTATPPKFVEERINLLINWYNKNSNILHPLVLALVVHNQFVYIHPFDDGNGRVARLLFNFILIKHGYFPIIFYNDQKNKYYSHIRGSKGGDIRQAIYYCLELYREQLEVF